MKQSKMAPMNTGSTVESNAITLEHPSGAKAIIHPWGATVTSFRTASGRELLYTSPKASLEGPKAIRGGVPIVFPQCRQPDKSIPNHGFLRINQWRVVETETEDSSATAKEFVLEFASDVQNGRGGIWQSQKDDINFEARYRVEIEPESFTTTLSVANTGSVDFPFQCLYHTYYRVHNGKATTPPRSVKVQGLDGYRCMNQDNQIESEQKEDFILVDQHTDCIFSPHPQDANKDFDVSVQTGDDAFLRITAKGMVDGKPIPVSVCVWNPHQEESQALRDFPDDGYHEMVGVEPGLLNNVPMLSSGRSMSFSVTTISA